MIQRKSRGKKGATKLVCESIESGNSACFLWKYPIAKPINQDENLRRFYFGDKLWFGTVNLSAYLNFKCVWQTLFNLERESEILR